MTHPTGFHYATPLHSTFMVCDICDARGLSFSAEYPLDWAIPCIENPEHTWVCACGRRYPTRRALAAHMRARIIRWPDGLRHTDFETLRRYADRSI